MGKFFYLIIINLIFISPGTWGKSKLAKRWESIETILLKKNIDFGFGGIFKTKKRFIHPLKKDFIIKKQLQGAGQKKVLNDDEKKKLAKEIVYYNIFKNLGKIKSEQRKIPKDIFNYRVLLPIKSQIHLQLIDAFSGVANKDFYKNNFVELESYTDAMIHQYFEVIETHHYQTNVLDPLSLYLELEDVNINSVNTTQSLITKTVDGYKNPLGRFYLSFNLTYQKLLKYVEIFDINVGINCIFSGALSMDPFFLLNRNFNDFAFGHFLTGLQLPDFLSIIPSVGALYLKIFFVTGLIVETTENGSVKVLAGTVFCFGFKEYGYVRFELLNDIHHAFHITINLIKKFLNGYIFKDYWPQEKKISSMDIWIQDFIESVSFYSIYFVRGRNNLFKSDFSRFLSKKVQANIKVFMANSYPKKNIKAPLRMAKQYS